MPTFVMRASLSTFIFAGLILGVACGLFLGEHAAVLSVLGDAFIGLLQMTVLPYIAVGLVTNIGRLAPGDAKRSGAYTAIFLVASLIVTLLAVVLLPMSLPERQAGAFFSTSLLEEPTETNFVELFIPSNPFYSLANNLVPAVVLFSIAVGLDHKRSRHFLGSTL